MIWIYVHLCGIVLVTAIEYQLSCPDKLQRHLRGQNCTARGTHYLCLFNILENINMENCASEDFKAQPGFRKIRKPGITNGNCTVNRYQPVIFSTYKFSNCMYTKSHCEEEGQVVVSDRTGYQDRTCRCDYRAGYSYIIPPRSLCACVPSEEDCSCMRKYCGHNETLSADYKCVPEKLMLTLCSKISTSLLPSTTSLPTGTSLQQEPLPPSSTFTESSAASVSVTIFMILLMGIGVMILLKLRVFPELTSYKIEFDKPSHIINTDVRTETYTVIEGCKEEVVFIYKSLLPCGVKIKNVDTGQMLKGKKEAEKRTTSDEKPTDIRNAVYVSTDGVWIGEKEAEKGIKSDEKPKDILTAGHVSTGGVLNGEKESEKGIKSDEKPRDILTAVKRKSSRVVLNLTKNNSGTYELVLKNKIYLPSTMMERWKRFHARLVNFLYKEDGDEIDDDENCSSGRFELIISTLPESYEKVDAFFGKKIEFPVRQSTDNESQHKKVVWFRLYKDNQLTVIQTDKSVGQKGQKNFSGGWHNSILMINQTCMRDAGRYVCFVKLDGGAISSYGWELRVIPQESAYEEMQAHKNDKDYVRLPFVSDAKHCLEKNNFVVLKGREGTGKTKMALDLALSLEEKGYLPVIVRSEEDIMEEFKGSLVLYIFDMSNETPTLWKEELKQFIPNNQSHVFNKAIFTRRWIDLSECKDLKGLMIDINYGLTVDIKRKILKNYLNRSGVAVVPAKDCNFNSKVILKDSNLQVKLDTDSVNMIVKEEPLRGFPLMARQFCNDRRNLHIGEKYFSNPPKDIIYGIEEMSKRASAVDASLQEILRYVILVYITLYVENQLDINKIDYGKFMQVKSTINKDIQPLPQGFECIQVDVEDAANSLLGEYLSCSENLYKLIHQDLLKAVSIVFECPLDFIVKICSLNFILRLIRGQRYKDDEGEVVLKLGDDKESMHNLIVNLLTKFTQKTKADTYESNAIALNSLETAGEHTLTVVPELSFPDGKVTKSIGDYIYKYWIKERDTEFCNELFIYLAGKNSEDNRVVILPWQFIKLVNHMTDNRKDPWIYSIEGMPDKILMFGLLSACQEACRETLVNMLSLLSHRMSTENKDDKKNSFQTKLDMSLDMYGNTFFHYLVLYNDTTGFSILKSCFKDAKGKMEEKETENAKNFRPIDMAVALGKLQIFKFFWNPKEGKKKKEKLKKIFEEARKSFSGKRNSENGNHFDENMNFDSEISRSVHLGSEEDYKAIEEILWKK